MESPSSKLKPPTFLIVMLISQFIVDALVLSGFSVATQIIVFIYFSFVPGFLILRLIRLNELDQLEAVFFSVGLSIAFLMFTGLIMNEIFPIFDISSPLSFGPLIVVLNIFVVTSTIMIYLRGEDTKLWETGTIKEYTFTILLLALLVLTIVGVVCVNIYNDNLILLSMIVFASLLFAITVLSKRLYLPRLYPIFVFIIALSLLFHSSLISNYLVHFGSDASREFFVFRSVQEDSYWTSSFYSGDVRWGRVHSMLSVTILPTIYSNLLRMDPTWVFKILFPLIFSLVPVVLYKLWEPRLGGKQALVSTFFFISFRTFYSEMLGLNRQMIAELFLALILFTILNRKMKSRSRIVFFMIFSVALVTSHYGIAEILLMFVSVALILLIVTKSPSTRITIGMIAFLFVVMFSWYIYTSDSSVFESFLSFGESIRRNLSDFFDLTTRQSGVLRGLGLEASPTIWNTISRLFAYATEFLIIVGFVGIITKRVKFHYNRDFSIFSSIAMGFLILLILVPGLAETMNMTRFYHILLFFLAPLCVVGAELIIKLMFRRKYEFWTFVLLLTILIPYFLFQTNFAYEVTGSDSWSMSLSKYRMGPYRLRGHLGYLEEQDVLGAKWLSRNVDVQNTEIFADSASISHELTCYAMIFRGYMNELTNVTSIPENGIIYLSRLNIIDGLMVANFIWNTTELSILNDANKLYSNGGSEIYKNPYTTVPSS
jgi:uncharacterized membrane protein